MISTPPILNPVLDLEGFEAKTKGLLCLRDIGCIILGDEAAKILMISILRGQLSGAFDEEGKLRSVENIPVHYSSEIEGFLCIPCSELIPTFLGVPVLAHQHGIRKLLGI